MSKVISSLKPWIAQAVFDTLTFAVPLDPQDTVVTSTITTTTSTESNKTTDLSSLITTPSNNNINNNTTNENDKNVINTDGKDTENEQDFIRIIDYRPRLVQVVDIPRQQRNHNSIHKNTNTNFNAFHDKFQLILVADKLHSIALYVPIIQNSNTNMEEVTNNAKPNQNNFQNDLLHNIERGSLITIRNWAVTTTSLMNQSCTSSHTLPQGGGPICLVLQDQNMLTITEPNNELNHNKLSNNIILTSQLNYPRKILESHGCEGMGIYGGLLDVHDDIDIRRALSLVNTVYKQNIQILSCYNYHKYQHQQQPQQRGSNYDYDTLFNFPYMSIPGFESIQIGNFQYVLQQKKSLVLDHPQDEETSKHNKEEKLTSPNHQIIEINDSDNDFPDEKETKSFHDNTIITIDHHEDEEKIHDESDKNKETHSNMERMVQINSKEDEFDDDDDLDDNNDNDSDRSSTCALSEAAQFSCISDVLEEGSVSVPATQNTENNHDESLIADQDMQEKIPQGIAHPQHSDDDDDAIFMQTQEKGDFDVKIGTETDLLLASSKNDEFGEVDNSIIQTQPIEDDLRNNNDMGLLQTLSHDNDSCTLTEHSDDDDDDDDDILLATQTTAISNINKMNKDTADDMQDSVESSNRCTAENENILETQNDESLSLSPHQETNTLLSPSEAKESMNSITSNIYDNEDDDINHTRLATQPDMNIPDISYVRVENQSPQKLSTNHSASGDVDVASSSQSNTSSNPIKVNEFLLESNTTQPEEIETSSQCLKADTELITQPDDVLLQKEIHVVGNHVGVIHTDQSNKRVENNSDTHSLHSQSSNQIDSALTSFTEKLKNYNKMHSKRRNLRSKETLFANPDFYVNSQKTTGSHLIASNKSSSTVPDYDKTNESLHDKNLTTYTADIPVTQNGSDDHSYAEYERLKRGYIMPNTTKTQRKHALGKRKHETGRDDVRNKVVTVDSIQVDENDMKIYQRMKQGFFESTTKSQKSQDTFSHKERCAQHDVPFTNVTNITNSKTNLKDIDDSKSSITDAQKDCIDEYTKMKHGYLDQTINGTKRSKPDKSPDIISQSDAHPPGTNLYKPEYDLSIENREDDSLMLQSKRASPSLLHRFSSWFGLKRRKTNTTNT